MHQSLPRIWIVTDPAHPEGPVVPIQRALESCPPGMVGVQLRAKRVSDRQLVDWGRALRSVTDAKGCALVVNRRVDVAEIVGADGVHIPELGLPLPEIREHRSSTGMIGVSRHDPSGLAAAEQAGASYAFLSPVFDVPGKSQPMGIHGFGAAIAHVGIPTYALGGIQAEDLKALFAAGAFGIAIRRAVYSAADPAEVLQRFLSGLDKLVSKGD